MVRHAELEQLPFFPQERFQCGPAALATALEGAGVTVTPEQLEPEVYLPQRHGSLQVELMAAARRRAIPAYRLEPPYLENLVREIAAGHAVLVMQNLGFGWAPQWHYAVVAGYDLDERYVILRSGRERAKQNTLALFERTWQRAGFWALVLVPPPATPATATPSAYLRAAHELEQAAQQEAAERSYRAAATRWPDESAPEMALGNLFYGKKRYLDAEQAFRRAVELHPQEAAGWNNLAYALWARGCVDEARSAVQCAARLAPEDGNIAQSVTELSRPNPASRLGEAVCLPVKCAHGASR